MTPPPRARLFHTIVAMGVALTGGTMVACGGATEGGPAPVDGGPDSISRDAHESEQYATIGVVPYGNIDAGERATPMRPSASTTTRTR